VKPIVAKPLLGKGSTIWSAGFLPSFNAFSEDWNSQKPTNIRNGFYSKLFFGLSKKLSSPYDL
jgi:hypothetical protein